MFFSLWYSLYFDFVCIDLLKPFHPVRSRATVSLTLFNSTVALCCSEQKISFVSPGLKVTAKIAALPITFKSKTLYESDIVKYV